MYKPTRHSYEKRMKNQRRKAKAGLLLATTLTAGMAVNPSPAVTGLASYLTGTGNVSVVQAAETLSISKENVTKINISEQTPEEVWGDMQIKIVLDTPGTLHIKEVKEGAVVTLENDVFDRTKWESQLSLTPGMFDGNGTVIIEEGTFEGKEISHGVIWNQENFSLSTMGDDESEEKFTTSVQNFIINGGNYGVVEIYEAKQNSNDYLYQTNLLINNASLTKTVCNSDRNASIEYGSCADVKENETGTGYIITNTNHDYGAADYSWSADKSICTASRICQKDKTHIETEKATVTSAVTTQPTYEKTGVRTYTAAFKNAAFSTQTQTETIAKRVKPQENIQTKTSIKKASVSGISNKNYNGKSQKQSIKVKLGKKTLKQGTDYTVSYKNNKNIGKATVTIKGKGKYEGSIKKTFQITVAKGKTYTAGNFKYKMTNASTNGKGTVTLAATTKSKSDKKFTSCKIADTVKIGGKTFKVTAIGDDAFKGYKKLKTITIESKNIESVGKNAVKNIHKEATIKVPKNKVKEYKKLFNKNTGFTSKMTIKKA